MRKILFILGLSMFLTACGGNDKPKVDEGKSESIQETEVEKKEDKKEENKTEEVKAESENKDTEENKEEKKEEKDSTSTEVIEPSQADGKFELGKAYKIGDVVVTVKSLSFVKDSDGKTALKVVSDWENKSEKTNSPFYSYIITGFQDGEEMDLPFVLDGVDYAKGQEEVGPSEKIEGVETVVEIADMNKTMELVLEEFGSIDSTPLKMIVDLNSIE